MQEIVILVAAHKQFPDMGLEGYFPVQVGAAACADLGYQRDDEGENISAKNPQYCELTAQYWAWKNMRGPRILGLVHYRRYFVRDLYAKDLKSQILTAQQAGELLKEYDVILPKPVYKLQGNGSLYKDRPRERQNEHLLLMEEIIHRRCPEYIPSFEKFVYGKRASFGNMFIASAERFNAYNAWVFPLLEEFERLGEQAGIMIPRLCGFMSEYLLCTWVDHEISPEKVWYMDVCNTEEDRKKFAYRARKFLVKLKIFEPAGKLLSKVYYAWKRC